MDYHFYHLQDRTSSHPRRLLELLQKKSALPGVKTWGVFPGLFGLGTNETYWVTQSDLPQSRLFEPDDEIEVLDSLILSPTVRPIEFAERTRAGVYVFRWFALSEDKIAEVVALSNEAWESFEGGFDTEVQGLFTVSGGSRYGMVLVTWYKDLNVWQASREPAPQARKNFLARQALLTSARPIATRLELL